MALEPTANINQYDAESSDNMAFHHSYEPSQDMTECLCSLYSSRRSTNKHAVQSKPTTVLTHNRVHGTPASNLQATFSGSLPLALVLFSCTKAYHQWE